MKENLEKYLRENRLRLDVEEPEEDIIWEGIRDNLHRNKQTLPTWFWKAAAIFIFVVSATYFVVNETSKNKVILVTLDDVSKELGNQEMELKQTIDLKWKEIEPQIPQNDKHFQFLINELNELDNVYSTYQTDLGQTLENEKIINAMLDYYEKKIKILNRILLEIEKQKDHETISL